MERLVSVAGSTGTGMGFRCGETLGRGAWARAVSVGFRPYPWASGCRRWPAEREMGVYVCRSKFGVLLSSLPVLKATLGSGSGRFRSRVDSHCHGAWLWRSVGPRGFGGVHVAAGAAAAVAAAEVSRQQQQQEQQQQ